MSLKRTLVTGITWMTLMFNGTAVGAGPRDARDAFDSAKRAADFANHVENGVDAAQAVNRTKKVVGVATGAVGAAVVNKTAEEVLENKAENVVRDEFRDLVEDEVGDQISRSVGNQVRGKARKALVR